MEKVENKNLKEYIFNNLLPNEGITLEEIASLSSEITKTFIDFKKVLISSGLISPNDVISRAKIINHNSINYLFIRKTSAEYIVINLNDGSFLKDKDKELFSQAFFISKFKEESTIPYKAYSFDSKPGSISKVYEYVLKNRKYLDLDIVKIYFSIEDEIAKTLIYFDITTGESVIHFKTKDNSINQQIFLFRNFESLDKDPYTSKVPTIKVPKEYIPDYILKDDKIKKIN